MPSLGISSCLEAGWVPATPSYSLAGRAGDQVWRHALPISLTEVGPVCIKDTEFPCNGPEDCDASRGAPGTVMCVAHKCTCADADPTTNGEDFCAVA